MREGWWFLFLCSVLIIVCLYNLQKAELKQCETGISLIKSANQQVYEYYHDISAAELKAYALVQLAYMFYTIYGRGNFNWTTKYKLSIKVTFLLFVQRKLCSW